MKIEAKKIISKNEKVIKSRSEKKDKEDKMKALDREISEKRKEFWKLNLEDMVDDFLSFCFD